MRAWARCRGMWAIAFHTVIRNCNAELSILCDPALCETRLLACGHFLSTRNETRGEREREKEKEREREIRYHATANANICTDRKCEFAEVPRGLRNAICHSQTSHRGTASAP